MSTHRETARRQRDDAWHAQQQLAGAGFNDLPPPHRGVNPSAGAGLLDDPVVDLNQQQQQDDDNSVLSGTRINVRVNDDLRRAPFLPVSSSTSSVVSDADAASGGQAFVWPAKRPNEGFADRALKGSQALRDHRIQKLQQQAVRSKMESGMHSNVAVLSGENAVATAAAAAAAAGKITTDTKNDSSLQTEASLAEANATLHDDNEDGDSSVVPTMDEINSNNVTSDTAQTSVARAPDTRASSVVLPSAGTFEQQQKQQREKEQRIFEARDKIRRQRESLPIFHRREELLAEVRTRNVFILQGETGCGKSTQLPQYLLEAGFATPSGPGIIAVTQPRRVAAIGVARRVAEERGCQVGGEVGYAVRLEDESTEQTRLRFMTEGVLLRECIGDPKLWKYNVVVIDEAHERSVDTDVLLGVMKRILRERADFKLIIMSATIQVERFRQFFRSALELAPTEEVKGRTFPVTPVFSNIDVADYVEEAVMQVVKAHVEGAGGGGGTSSNDGDILVFMTGEEDVQTVCDLVSEKVAEIEKSVDSEEKLQLQIVAERARAAGRSEEEAVAQHRQQQRRRIKKLDVIPCFSTILVNKAQLDRVLNPAVDPTSTRKCIVATNVAETSLTIDGITTVIDAGLMKCKVYDPKSRVHQLLTFPISQAQAKQREGRAGRTRAGTCVKLYTERAFQTEMLVAPVPEIKRSSIDAVCLFVKSIGIDDVTKFDFIDPPPTVNVHKSLWALWLLGLLDDAGKLTSKGRTAASLPVEPAMAAVLVTAKETNCLDGAVSIAAMLSVDTRALFNAPRDRQEQARGVRAALVDLKSDHLTFKNILDRFREESGKEGGGAGGARRWAEQHYLSFQVLKTASGIRDKLEEQTRSILNRQTNRNSNSSEVFADIKFRDAREALRFCIVSGFFPQCAIRVAMERYRTILTYNEAEVPPNSALCNGTAQFVVFNELAMTVVQKNQQQKQHHQSSSSGGGNYQQHRPGSASAAAATKIETKSFLSVVTAAEGQWLERVSRGLFFVQGGPLDPRMKQLQQNPAAAAAGGAANPFMARLPVVNVAELEQQSVSMARSQIEAQLQELRAAQEKPPLLPSPSGAAAASAALSSKQPPAAKPPATKKFVPRKPPK